MTPNITVIETMTLDQAADLTQDATGERPLIRDFFDEQGRRYYLGLSTSDFGIAVVFASKLMSLHLDPEVELDRLMAKTRVETRLGRTTTHWPNVVIAPF